MQSKFIGSGNPIAVKRLSNDLKKMIKEKSNLDFEISTRGDNLFIWDVKMRFPKDSDSKLQEQLEQYHKKYKTGDYVHFEITFPEDYPFSPPFVRVITPHFMFHTGHITIGGSICMEFLTKADENGWSASMNMENTLVSIQTQILMGNPQLDFSNSNAYTMKEAQEAFRRVAGQHGWKI